MMDNRTKGEKIADGIMVDMILEEIENPKVESAVRLYDMCMSGAEGLTVDDGREAVRYLAQVSVALEKKVVDLKDGIVSDLDLYDMGVHVDGELRKRLYNRDATIEHLTAQNGALLTEIAKLKACPTCGRGDRYEDTETYCSVCGKGNEKSRLTNG